MLQDVKIHVDIEIKLFIFMENFQRNQDFVKKSQVKSRTIYLDRINAFHDVGHDFTIPVTIELIVRK